jgi:hypothetical protein
MYHTPPSNEHQAAAAVLGELKRHMLSSSRPAATILVSRLEDAVRTYEVEFRGYLNGQGQRPPLQLGAVISTAFQELASAPDRRRADAFRIDSLEARFHASRRLLTHRLERDDRRLPVHAARLA